MRLEAFAFGGRIVTAVACLGVAAAMAPAHAARLADERMLSAEQFAAMEPLQVVSVNLQRGPGVLFVDPRTGPQPTVMPLNPALAGGGFAAGAAAGAIGMLVGDAMADQHFILARDQANELYVHAGLAPEWPDAAAALRAAVSDGLARSGLSSGEIVQRGPESAASPDLLSGCPEPDECLLLDTRWGITRDGTRVEVQVGLALWSKALRKPGRKVRRLPDFTNHLLYRSAPLALAEAKTDADRDALLASAKVMYEKAGIAALVARANASRDSDATAARRDAVPLLRAHGRRQRDARAGKWNDDARARRSAQLWGEDDGARLRAALDEASVEIARLIEIELSPQGHDAKSRETYRARDGREMSIVLGEDGVRVRGYRNDGVAVSQVRNDTSLPFYWSAVYP